jgi:hypothetical protein
VTAPCNLPDYVERGGRQVWRSPYHATGAQLLGLVLPGKQAAIDALLQRDLVAPTGGATDYRCAHDHVVVIFAQFASMASKEAPDAGRGFIPEREVSFWCLAADKTAKERLVWYLPYLFTDNGPAVAAGREVYGYPKQQADFDKSYSEGFNAKGAKTTVTAMGIDVYAPKAQMQPRPMVALTRAAGVGNPPSYAGTFFAEFASNLFPGGLSVNTNVAVTSGAKPSATITASATATPAQPTVSPPWMKSAITALTGAGLASNPDDLVADMIDNPNLVFLKQFRDVRCPGKACYQAVVEAPLSIDPLKKPSFESLDPALFAVEVQQYASHPMQTDLGLAAGVQTPSSAFLASIDFDILTGLEVWRA